MKRSDPILRIGHLYPNDMNIYGDLGNVRTLMCRAQWREIGVEAINIGTGPADLDKCDILFIGGGQDRDQSRVFQDFVNHKRESMVRAMDDGVAILAVCGGYQLLGHAYVDAKGHRLQGLGVLDLTSEAGDNRWIGNVVIEPDAAMNLSVNTVVGFENHGGRTFLGPGLRPFGRVRVGGGNNGRDGGEGVWQGTVIGTYLHGPLLPKNPAVADWLLARGLAHARLSAVEPLSPLPDMWEKRAHDHAVRIALSESGRQPVQSRARHSYGRP